MKASYNSKLFDIQPMFTMGSKSFFAPTLFRACFIDDLNLITEVLPTSDLLFRVNQLHIFYFVKSKNACNLILNHAAQTIGLEVFINDIFPSTVKILSFVKTFLAEDKMGNFAPLWEAIGKDNILCFIRNAEKLYLNQPSAFESEDDMKAICNALREYAPEDKKAFTL